MVNTLDYVHECSLFIKRSSKTFLFCLQVIKTSGNDDLEMETFNPRTFFEEINQFKNNSELVSLNLLNIN